MHQWYKNNEYVYIGILYLICAKKIKLSSLVFVIIQFPILP